MSQKEKPLYPVDVVFIPSPSFFRRRAKPRRPNKCPGLRSAVQFGLATVQPKTVATPPNPGGPRVSVGTSRPDAGLPRFPTKPLKMRLTNKAVEIEFPDSRDLPLHKTKETAPKAAVGRPGIFSMGRKSC